MALRDQPYIPLYVQDVLTDEKLIECSAESHGVYLRLLCILHKQEQYGVICLKQKHKQNDNQILNFALMLTRQMPFDQKQIASGLSELVDEGVLIIDGDCLYQKRMKRDGELSLIRSEVGKKGGSPVAKQYGKPGYLYLMSDTYEKHKIGVSVNPLSRLYRIRSDNKLPKHFDVVKKISVLDMGKTEDFAMSFFGDLLDGEWIISDYETVINNFDLLEAKIKAKTEANTEYENEYESEDINSSNKIKRFIRPTVDQIEKYLIERGKEKPRYWAEKIFDHYEGIGWVAKGSAIRNWKNKVNSAWEIPNKKSSGNQL